MFFFFIFLFKYYSSEAKVKKKIFQYCFGFFQNLKKKSEKNLNNKNKSYEKFFFFVFRLTSLLLKKNYIWASIFFFFLHKTKKKAIWFFKTCSYEFVREILSTVCYSNFSCLSKHETVFHSAVPVYFVLPFYFWLLSTLKVTTTYIYICTYLNCKSVFF